MNDYQNSDMDAAIPVRASVSVAMDDVAAAMREGLLALAVGAGLQVTVHSQASPLSAQERLTWPHVISASAGLHRRADMMGGAGGAEVVWAG
jgi:hypothetical protein